jgi:5-methylcytosine-specific restriction endonuclease McrA
MMSRVLVIDANRQPLMPCTPARARILLAERKAAVLRRFPFTLILREAKPQAAVAPLRLKIDPGAKTTGMAVLHAETSEVLWAAELTHRGEQVRGGLMRRRGVRRSRRARHTRYRAPRFRNRRRAPGWLPPSLLSRVHNVETWVARLRRLCPISALSYELVRFDTQLLQNPEVENLDYQKGTLFGIELRHYLLAKWEHRCAYCQTTAVPLEMDHVEPRARGGSDRVANRVPACHTCNQAKADKLLEEFLADRPAVLARVQAQRQAPLKDAAAVNATRLVLYRRLQATGLAVETGAGALTKWNRQQQGLPKAHWVDAACCGASTPAHLRLQTVRPWLITATGRQNRQMRNVDKHGFPVGRAKGPSRVRGFRTGDLVKAVCPAHLKKAGTHVGRVLVRTRGIFDVQTRQGRVKDIPARYCQRLQAADGYRYALGTALPPHA